MCQFSDYLRMAPKLTFSAPWELLIKFWDSESMIFKFYMSKLTSVPIFRLFENGSKTDIFGSVRALDQILRFWDYDSWILHVKINKYANFQLVWEWLQNWLFRYLTILPTVVEKTYFTPKIWPKLCNSYKSVRVSQQIQCK